MKLVNVEDLVIGKMYYVHVVGSSWTVWNLKLTYVGSLSKSYGKPEYWFTFGTLENYNNSFNLACTKSRLRIREVENNE